MSLLLLLLACGDKDTGGQPQPQDLDADGVTIEEGDCNDEDASVFPGNTEICDGIDNDCNDEIDEGLVVDFYADADGDGFGSDLTVESACEAPEGFVTMAGDCDDADAEINPNAEEICDELDNNCDTLVDDADPFVADAMTYYLDYDGDGYGNADFSDDFCVMPAQYVDNADDCDDLQADIHPEAVEICDEMDNNCDGNIDDADANIQYTEADNWYTDLDMDGYGETGNFTQSCLTPPGSSQQDGDCDDANFDVNPGVAEVCDAVDNNCDGNVDDADPMVTYTPDDMWYVDADADGYGNANMGVAACMQPTGFVADATDCDDINALNNPMGTEVCDGIDNNCDTFVDDADPAVVYDGSNMWYIDADGDGYGVVDQSTEACVQPTGYVDNTDDCDDVDASISPMTTWYADMDMDGFGDVNDVLTDCTQPMGYVLDDQDCDDTDERSNPLMAEICGDGVSNDCDLDIDEAATCDLTQNISDWSVFTAFGDEDSFFGKQVRPAGDVVSGINSIAISANRGDTNGLSDNGAVYFYDNTAILTGSLDPSQANASIHGSTAADYFGTIVAAMDPMVGPSSADVNGDGIADIAISATLADANGNKSGSVYIFHGGFTGDLDAETHADAILLGEGNANQAGFDMSFIDANDDGNADLLVGAPYNSNLASFGGAAYIVEGPIVSGVLDVQASAIFYGENASDYAGNAVINTGDMNGDGLDDFAISAYRADPVDATTLVEYENAGIVYVFTSGASGVTALEDADMQVYGDLFSAYVGREMSTAGDVNGDGLADILIGARNRPTSGSVFLVSGDSSLPAELWLTNATARLDGDSSQAEFGKSSTALSDINGDGFDDIAVGAKAENGGSGAAYIYYGPLTGAYESGDYHGVFTGLNNGQAGISMANIGDVDGSGQNDLMVGAYFEETNGYRAGAAYLLLGEDILQ